MTTTLKPASAWPFPTGRVLEKPAAAASHDRLLNACKAVDADIELTGKVSAASIDMVRAAIAQAVL